MAVDIKTLVNNYCTGDSIEKIVIDVNGDRQSFSTKKDRLTIESGPINLIEHDPDKRRISLYVESEWEDNFRPKSWIVKHITYPSIAIIEETYNYKYDRTKEPKNVTSGFIRSGMYQQKL